MWKNYKLPEKKKVSYESFHDVTGFDYEFMRVHMWIMDVWDRAEKLKKDCKKEEEFLAEWKKYNPDHKITDPGAFCQIYFYHKKPKFMKVITDAYAKFEERAEKRPSIRKSKSWDKYIASSYGKPEGS